MYNFRFFRPIAVATIASICSVSFAVTAHAEDPADSFDPKPACSIAESSTYLPTLRKGHYGLSVQYMQDLLGVHADGCFGAQTDTAVRQYQSRKGLVADGIVGSCTWKALQGDSVPESCKAKSPPTSTTSPTSSTKPAACGNFKCVVVDQGKNMVRLYYRNGNLYAEGGMVDNPSKLSKDTYWIGYKQASGIDDASELLWLPNYMQFSGDIGFHKIPLNKSTGNPIHSESYLGTNQKKSGGCIRLGDEFSDLLWSFASVGTIVVVI
jgi:hypothetical protein